MLNESTAARVFSSCAEHPAARRFPFVLPGTGTPYVQHRSPAGLTGLSASAARCTGIQAASRFSFLARFERAASSLPTFKPDSEALLAIGEICSRLEGIPLAIELAAARVKTLTVHQILQRTTNLLDLLHVSSGTAVQRHRTMAAVMDWSYNLLTDPERELFARLSVFHGDFSLQSAEKICHGEGIREEQAVNKKDLLRCQVMSHEGCLDADYVDPYLANSSKAGRYCCMNSSTWRAKSSFTPAAAFDFSTGVMMTRRCSRSSSGLTLSPS